MKIALINGSPKGKKSTSQSLLNGLKSYIESDNIREIKEFMWNMPSSGINDFEEVLKYDVIVYAFPLYVDSIPSHLLSNLVSFEEYIKKHRVLNNKEINIYAIVNNGFFDGKQNCLAIESIEHFCNRVGFNFKQGIGVGGGGMISSIENIPFGQGPKKTIGTELNKMSKNIKNEKGDKTIFIEPNFPAFAYKFMAEMGWRRAIKKNGLKVKDLARRLT